MDGYVHQLETLQKIREIAGGQSLHLPQICVVGDQSSGKSSLLKLLTGVDFPVQAGTCTKAAIVVECKKQEEEKYEIMELETTLMPPDSIEWGVPLHKQTNKQTNKLWYPSLGYQMLKTKEYAECESSELSTKILECQKKMLDSGGGSKISTDEIKIKVAGEEKIDIIVVDLPGIINNGPGRDETRRLIEKYIAPEQTLIFLVSEAKTDAELIGADELATKFDPEGSRTMKVLTKFDTFDSDETQKRAMSWILENKDKELGAHAVIAAPEGKNYDENKERAKLKAMELPEERSGIEALKIRLPPIYAKLIQTNLPNLREAIEQKMEEAYEVLHNVGETPKDGTSMIKDCQIYMMNEVTRIEETLTPPMVKVQNEIHEKESQIKEDWTSSKFSPNVFKVPFFSGETAFRTCFSEISQWWWPIVEEYIQSVSKIMEEAIDRIEEEISIPQTLTRAITTAWKTNNKEIIRSFSQACHMELDKFKNFGTVNHYLTSEYQKEMVLPKEAIDMFIRNLTIDSKGNCVNETSMTIRGKLESVLEAHTEEFSRKSLHEQQQISLFAAVKAAYKVEKKTFTDLIMKTTNIHILEEVKNWINIDLFQNEKIKEAAKEDGSTVIKRRKALETVEKMNKCLMEINTIM